MQNIDDFEKFYEEQLPNLRSYFNRHTRSSAVEDLIQDTFLKFVKHYSDKITVTPVQYLFVIAKTVLATHINQRMKSRECEGEVEIYEDDPRMQAEEELEGQGRQLEALQFLAQEDQNLLDMRFRDGKTIAECAAATGRSPSSVSYRLKRCLNEARRHFDLGHTSPCHHLFDLAFRRIDAMNPRGKFLDALKEITFQPLTSTSLP